MVVKGEIPPPQIDFSKSNVFDTPSPDTLIEDKLTCSFVQVNPSKKQNRFSLMFLQGK